VSSLETVRLPIEGMTCGSCVGRIERMVRRLDGVERVRVSLRDETMTVRRDPLLASDTQLALAVEQAGYRADPDRAEPVTAEVSRGLLARLIGL
jgi:Cu+-exporting ATPase